MNLDSEENSKSLHNENKNALIDDVKEIEKYCNYNKPLFVHLKIDSGMGIHILMSSSLILCQFYICNRLA